MFRQGRASTISSRSHIDYCRARLAHAIALGTCAPRTTDSSDNSPLFDQGNATSRRNHPIEREQIVEMHKVDAVLEDLGWAPEGCGCPRLVFRDLYGGKHRAVHSLKGNQVTTRIRDRDVHFP